MRSSSEPAADTQMQMQRWFGYRGSYLPICRVFLLEDQLNLFRQYNVQDKAIKSLILKRMAMPTEEELQGTLVLEGQQFVATSKVDTRKIPLSPGLSPQIRLVERLDPELARSNTDLLLAALAEGDWDEIDPVMQVGIIRRELVSLLEVAGLLERLRYSRHDPALDDEMSRRWVSLQHALGLEDALFRPPREMRDQLAGLEVPAGDARRLIWVVPCRFGTALTATGAYEIFLGGPELSAMVPLLAQQLQYDRWEPNDGGPSFAATRVLLGSAPHFAAMAAFCTS